MKLTILLAVLILSIIVGNDARRNRDRLRRVHEEERSERHHIREKQRDRESYRRKVDDAIITKVRRSRHNNDDLHVAADDDTKVKRQGVWPGDFQIQQILYPDLTQFPQPGVGIPRIPNFPSFPQHQLPTNPWSTQRPQIVPQQTLPPQTQRPQTQRPTTQAPITHPPSGGQSTSCGKTSVYSEDTPTRIIEGAPTRPGEFPFLVALMRDNGKQQLCGGTLIDANTILTAAHCFDGATAAQLADLQVFMGAYNIYNNEPGTVKRHISKLISHASWDKRTNYHDIAMLKLASPVPFSANIQPICLARSAGSYNAGNSVTVAGWGRTSPIDGTPQTPQRTPLKITVPLVNNQVCQNNFLRVSISEHMVCAGEGTKSACLGDSGGALMRKTDDSGQRWEQVGIVSWGYNCVGLTVYTRVAEFQDWIQKWRDS